MLIEKLYAESVWRRSPMSNGNIRMSMVESCPRQQAYVALGYDQDFSEGGRSQMAADDGNLHEADVVARFITAGYRCWNYGDEQAMVYLKKGNLSFRGHPDLFMETPEGEVLGVELKGYRDEVFRAFVQGALQLESGIWSVNNMDRLTKRPYPLMGQIQMYLNSETAKELGIEKWVLVMKNKNNAELAECVVEKDPVYLDNLFRKWKDFWNLIAVGRLPERFFGDDSIECRRCVFREKCWGLGEVNHDGGEILKLQGLEKAAEQRRDGTTLKKNGELLLEEARMAFLTEHIRNEVDKIECDDMLSTVSERNRRGLNSSEVNKVLSDMLEKGNITYQAYDDCFTESSYQEVRFRDKKLT